MSPGIHAGGSAPEAGGGRWVACARPGEGCTEHLRAQVARSPYPASGRDAQKAKQLLYIPRHLLNTSAGGPHRSLPEHRLPPSRGRNAGRRPSSFSRAPGGSKHEVTAGVCMSHTADVPQITPVALVARQRGLPVVAPVGAATPTPSWQITHDLGLAAPPSGALKTASCLSAEDVRPTVMTEQEGSSAGGAHHRVPTSSAVKAAIASSL